MGLIDAAPKPVQPTQFRRTIRARTGSFATIRVPFEDSDLVREPTRKKGANLPTVGRLPFLIRSSTNARNLSVSLSDEAASRTNFCLWTSPNFV